MDAPLPDFLVWPSGPSARILTQSFCLGEIPEAFEPIPKKAKRPHRVVKLELKRYDRKLHRLAYILDHIGDHSAAKPVKKKNQQKNNQRSDQRIEQLLLELKEVFGSKH